jgi:hypothetical protein
MQMRGSVRLALALVALGAPSTVAAQEAEMPVRQGRFVARDLQVVPAKKVTIISDVAGNPLALGSVDVSVTIVNETGEDWQEALFDVSLFDALGDLIRSLGKDHSVRIHVPIRNGETKPMRFRNMAILLPGNTAELAVARYGISVPEIVAQARTIASGTTVGFLAKDRQCAQESFLLSEFQGGKGRQGIAELTQASCGIAFESPIHGMVTRNESSFAQVTLAEGKFFGETGWVPAAWVK